MRKTKKLLAMLLCIVMCLSLFPVSVFAEEGTEAPVEEETVAAPESVPEAEEPAPAPEPEPVEEAPEPAAEEPAIEAEESAPAQDESGASVDETLPAEPLEAPAEDSSAPAEDTNTPAEEPAPAEEITGITDEAEAAADANAEQSAGAAEEESALSVQDIAEPYEFEEEEGLFHGFGGVDGDISIAGVYNTDYPVLKEFVMDPTDTYLEVGETVRFKFRFADADGIQPNPSYSTRYLYAEFGTSSGNTRHIPLTLNNETGYCEGEYTFSETDTPGAYYITTCYAEDTHSFYSRYSSNSRRVMQRFCPGYIYLQGEDAIVEQDPITDVNFRENGQTLSPGDEIYLSFSIPANLEIDSIWVTFRRGSAYSSFFSYSQYGEDNTLAYDKSTGLVSGSYTLPADLTNGQYTLSYIDVSGQDFEASKDFTSSAPYFILTGGAEASVGTSSLSVSNISSAQSGKTLMDGQTLKVSFKVTSDRPVTYASVILNYQSPYTHNNYGSGVSQGENYQKYVPATLNPTSGLYEVSYTFGADDLYGPYDITVTAQTESSTLREETDITVLFAENGNTAFKRLSPATKLKWKDGYATFTLPADHQGKFTVRVTDILGNYIGSITSYSYIDTDRNVSSDAFIRYDPPSGDYYFTVTILGDGTNYYNSETVKSDVFHFVEPSLQTGLVTGLSWTENSATGLPTGTFKMPSDTTYLRGYEYKFYFSETENGTPKDCMISGTGGAGDSGWDKKTGSITLWERVLQAYGNGYYRYQVRTLSSNITKCRNGEWSVMSPAHYVGNTAESTATKLNDIQTSGKTASEIKEQVQALGTAELYQTMLTDESAVNRLRELEAAAGALTQVVKTDNIPGLDGRISAVGAGLNPTGSDGPVTLSIGRPAEEHVLPATYDNTVAVRFSMNLDKVTDQENLQVPVLIDLPIPSSIDPSFLIVLHYHPGSDAPEQLHPYVYQAGNQWYAQIILTSFSDFIFTQRIKVMYQDYLMLTVGESTSATLFDESDPSVIQVSWYGTDHEGNYYSGSSDDVISVDPASGEILALNVGTAYVVAEITRDSAESPDYKRCRIDVIPAEDEQGEPLEQPIGTEVTQVSLPISKAVVDLYSTEYARFTVLAETENLSSQSALLPDAEVERPTDTGMALDHAEFTDPTAHGLFELKVVDDRTLAIVPLYSTLELAMAKASNVKGTYKSGIHVFMSDGSDYVVKDAAGKDAVLTMTVKKSLPKLKAGALAFNSVVAAYSVDREDTQVLSLTGGNVTALEPDQAAAAKAKKAALPSWLPAFRKVDGTWMATLPGDGPAKESGKLYLLATIEGCAVKQSIVVSYSVKQTFPTLSFSPKTITLMPASSDEAYVEASVKPALFAQIGYYAPAEGAFYPGTFEASISRVVDTADKKNPITDPDEIAGLFTLVRYGQYGENRIRFEFRPGENLSAGKTYNVFVMLGGKETGFTIKTPAAAKLKLKSYYSLNVYSGGVFYLQPSFTNFHYYSVEDYEVVIRKGNGASAPVVATYNSSLALDVDEPFFGIFPYYSFDNDVITYLRFNLVYDNEADGYRIQQEKADYYAYVTAILGYDGDGNPLKTEPASAKLKIGWSRPKDSSKPSKLSLSTNGAIDVIRPDSAFTVTVKETSGSYSWMISYDETWSQYDYETGDIIENPYFVFLKDGVEIHPKKEDDSENEDFPFALEFDPSTGKNYIRLKDGAAAKEDLLSHTFRLKIFNNAWNNKTNQPVYKEYKLSIKKGSASVKANPATVTLLGKDRFSQALVTLIPKDAKLSGIVRVEVSDTDKTSQAFDAIYDAERQSNVVAIGYDDSELQGFKGGQTKTVKLNVWFEGSWSEKPDAVVSVKVQIK